MPAPHAGGLDYRLVQKILISSVALLTLTCMSYGAPRKRSSHSSKRPAASGSTQTRPGAGKSRYRRYGPAYARRNYQAAPTPERYKEIQQALAGKGYFKGAANGEWGPDSVDALRRFQADQSLDVDGKIGSLSLIALGLGPKRMTAQAVQPSPPAQTKQP
jgi:peptidoglycan hydrolase-like protein with peptidoglycan-binding domain